ncbi:helix-turn-helix domain-containing protein [Labilibaculum antarcticum]|uniref:Transcriptional regulator n=1 Tax=Labilibaculum antarcticum TaxID=1717717 RepID=A0A1Y1CGG5_9BACT|nr:helix-turn-helix domain-containing protein [Labilibaculum antarcticum]BAX79173.1 transcriptional regulator [Labilibaculum antarcticum]
MNDTYINDRDNALFSIANNTSTSKKFLFEKDKYYRILWLQKGEASVTVDGIDYKLKENQIIFLTPLNKLELKNTPTEIISLVFNREFYCIQQHDQEVSCYGYLFFGSSDVPIVSLDRSEQVSFDLLYQVMREEFDNNDQIQGEMLQVLLKRFLIKSTRLARKILKNPEINQDKLDMIRKFNVLVEMHFKNIHKVSDYADLLNKSPKTLSNLFGEYNDKNPLQVIQERIVLEAKRLFLYTDKSAKEIAFELGFDDAAHFSRLFKNIAGKNPTEFKKTSIL